MDAYHDSRDSWGDSSAEELEGVLGNLFRCGFVLALGPRSNHAGLEKDTFKHDIVLSKVEENLSPYLLGHFKGPVDPMFPIKQNLRLHDWHQSIVLHNPTPMFHNL